MTSIPSTKHGERYRTHVYSVHKTRGAIEGASNPSTK